MHKPAIPRTSRLFRPLSRRALLRAAGVSVALPLLDAMLPVGLRAEQKANALKPRRMVLVSRPLGLHAPYFFPETPGRDYESTRYLKLLEEHRGDFTVFSGMSHLGYQHHLAEVGLFTGVAWERIAHPERELRNSISLDQVVAERIGRETRFRNLVLGGGNWPTSWSRAGVPVPSEKRAVDVFKQLFVDGSPEEVSREVRRLQDGGSILDGVRQQAKSLSQRLSPSDRDRIDLLFASIREAEQHLQQNESWARKPKPKVDYPAPTKEFSAAEVSDHERQWYDIVRLALQTDSTRTILLAHCETGNAKLPTGDVAHHDASHHGQDETKIEKLALVEAAEVTALAKFFTALKQVSESDGTLFDRTIVLCASNLGNASAHKGENLPIVLAGGGFKHQGHVAFDRKNNMPLCNLFVRMLQQMNLEIDRFGCSTGSIGEV